MNNARIVLIVAVAAALIGVALLWLRGRDAPSAAPPHAIPPQGDFATRFQPVPPPNSPPNTANRSAPPAAPTR